MQKYDWSTENTGDRRGTIADRAENESKILVCTPTRVIQEYTTRLNVHTNLETRATWSDFGGCFRCVSFLHNFFVTKNY
jgi:hypothetical protein